MALPTSRGKQSFREFMKVANALKKFTLAALKTGEQYTYAEIEGWYDEIIEQYNESLYADDIPNTDLWASRAEDVKSLHIDTISNLYPSVVTPVPDSSEEEDSGTEEDEQYQEGDVISGIPVISSAECTDGGDTVRGQILLTYEELLEYLEPIPPSVIRGLVPVYDENGNLRGYRLCGAKNT